jgi:hypothetical protein
MTKLEHHLTLKAYIFFLIKHIIIEILNTLSTLWIFEITLKISNEAHDLKNNTNTWF